MRIGDLVIAGVALLVVTALPVWAQDAQPAGQPAEGAQEEARPPVEVMGEVQVRPELKVFSGVKGWRVNGKEISLEEVSDRAILFHGPYILQDLVSRALLEQEASSRGISVTEQEVDAQIGALREGMGLRSEDALEFSLRQRRLTREGFREQAREYLLLSKVLADRVYVSDGDIERFYNRFRDILYYREAAVEFRIISFYSEEAARAALQELGKGRSLVEVAREQATDAAERAVAGDLHTYQKGQQPPFPPEFEAVLFAAPLNQVVGPIKAENRYHLVRVEKKTDPYQFTLDEVRDDIRKELRRQKLEQVVWPQWIRDQLAKAKIEIVGAEGPKGAGAEAGGGATPGQ
jgi:foldase protein PrsA